MVQNDEMATVPWHWYGVEFTVRYSRKNNSLFTGEISNNTDRSVSCRIQDILDDLQTRDVFDYPKKPLSEAATKPENTNKPTAAPTAATNVSQYFLDLTPFLESGRSSIRSV